MHQKDNPQKPPAKVKRTREKMQTILENRNKIVTNFPINVLKKNNKVEEGRDSGLRVKKEQNNTYVRAQKMMRGNVEPSAMPTMVRAMLIIV